MKSEEEIKKLIEIYDRRYANSFPYLDDMSALWVAISVLKWVLGEE